VKRIFLTAAILAGVSPLFPGIESVNAADASRVIHDCSVEFGACATNEQSPNQADDSKKAPAARDNLVGPRYDVTRLGATGDSSKDDTAAIQAAFDTCWNHGAPITAGGGYGGVVEFPGAKIFTISSTIYTYDSCKLEGMVNGLTPSVVQWNGPATGVVYNITSFAVAGNSTPYYPAYSPKPSRILPSTVTFPVTNSVAVNDWVLIHGFSTPTGRSINNTVAQVVAASGDSFTVVVPFNPTMMGTIADSGEVTTIGVMFASSATARYFEEVKDIQFQSKRGIAEAKKAGVDFYFGSRVDTGTRVWGTYATAPLYYGYYFSQGGIDIDFDKGWRADNPGIAGIYWRVTAQDNFGIANGTVSSHSGGAVELDNSACIQGNMVRLSSRNMGMEVEAQGLAPGEGIFTLLDCPSNVFPIQFAIDMENTKTAGDKGAISYPTIVMSPANDTALSLNIVNGVFPNGIGQNTTQRWVGVPGLTRYDASGQQGYIPSLTYAPPFTSAGNLGSSYNSERAMSQCIGDCNIGQLYQYGVPASAILYTDTAFTLLPNGTTLFAGQIIAPPAYWKAGEGGPFVFDVVRQTGTTGVLNGGSTTCRASGRQWQLACTSAIDLSVGQQVNVGNTKAATITRVDATDPTAVLVTLNKSIGPISTPTPLTFSAPLLAPEVDIPTKSASSPIGDSVVRNSASQTRTVQAFCTGTATSSATLTMFGGGSGTSPCTTSVQTESAGQVLMNTSGNVSGLAVRCARGGVSPLSGVFSIWDLPAGSAMSGPDSGVNTGLEVTYGSGKANTTLFDSTHNFAYAKGDLLRIQFTTQANETLGGCEASFNY
jgi:hypothetical protein